MAGRSSLYHRATTIAIAVFRRFSRLSEALDGKGCDGGSGGSTAALFLGGNCTDCAGHASVRTRERLAILAVESPSPRTVAPATVTPQVSSSTSPWDPLSAALPASLTGTRPRKKPKRVSSWAILKTYSLRCPKVETTHSCLNRFPLAPGPVQALWRAPNRVIFGSYLTASPLFMRCGFNHFPNPPWQ